MLFTTKASTLAGLLTLSLLSLVSADCRFQTWDHIPPEVAGPFYNKGAKAMTASDEWPRAKRFMADGITVYGYHSYRIKRVQVSAKTVITTPNIPGKTQAWIQLTNAEGSVLYLQSDLNQKDCNMPLIEADSYVSASYIVI